MSSVPTEKMFKQLEDMVKNQAIQIKSLEDRVTLLQDIQEIARLQRIYGYYLERWMNKEMIDLFSDSPECELNWMVGKWKGKEGVRRYFDSVRAKRKDLRFLHQLMQVSGVIDVDPDGKKAKGRWNSFGGMLTPGEDGINYSLSSGIYENEYIKEDGIWRMLKISWTSPFSVTIAPEDWRSPEERAEGFLSHGIEHDPDIVSDISGPNWTTGCIFPFHFKHPVTGKQTSEEKINARIPKFQPKSE